MRRLLLLGLVSMGALASTHANALVISGPVNLNSFTSGATFGGPPSPAHFTEPGPITVPSGTTTGLFTGPAYGSVDSVLLVISAASLPSNDVITLTVGSLAPVTFTAADFTAAGGGGFPSNIQGIANGNVNGVVFPTAVHAGADLTGLPGGLATDALLANVTVSQTVATNLRIDVFGDLNGKIVDNAANSGALGVTGSSPPPPTPVPEPATLSLLGSGLLGLGALLRRRKRSA